MHRTCFHLVCICMIFIILVTFPLLKVKQIWGWGQLLFISIFVFLLLLLLFLKKCNTNLTEKYCFESNLIQWYFLFSKLNSIANYNKSFQLFYNTTYNPEKKVLSKGYFFESLYWINFIINFIIYHWALMQNYE